MSCGENIDRFACRKEWSTHALTLPCAHHTFSYAECIEENHLTLCLRGETSLSLAFQLTRAHSWEENHAEDDEVVDEVEAPEGPAGRPRRRAESLRRRCLLSAWAFAENFLQRLYKQKWKTKCTPKDRSSSQGSQDEIHKPCFLLKIGSPILPKHPATWHEVGHPSGQDMAEKFLDLSNLRLTGSSGSYTFLLPNKLPSILFTNSIMLNYCIPTSLTHPLTQRNFSMMWEVVRVARIISSQ